MSDARQLIVKLLSNIGGRKEVAQYLKYYCDGDAPKFAVVQIAGDVLSGQLALLGASLGFLQRVGLHPVAVLDAPAPLLVTELLSHGCPARELLMGRARAELARTIDAGDVPVIVPAAGDEPASAAHELTELLEPHKLILLTQDGGWLSSKGAVINAINLAEDSERIATLSAERRARLARIGVLLDKLPASASVSITSPDHLARELFTHRGAGTLVRRGERVSCKQSFDEIDTDKLRDLLESCFGRVLVPSYFDDKNCYRVYVAEDYRATAILTREGGLPYLDKFAVTSKAQGEGLGGALWRRMRRDNDKLFWRAQTTNEVNAWYFQQADGSYKSDHWTVFWYGVHDFDEIRRCVSNALELPETLRAHGTSND